METNLITITHQNKDEAIDFNLRNVPYELMLSLGNALRWEHQKQTSILCAPDFRAERALQHQRHLEQCAKTGDTPKQMFIDFPIYT